MTMTRSELLEARGGPHPQVPPRPADIRRWLTEQPLPPRKEQAPCCLAHRDPEGRLPVGFCSPGCCRRPYCPDCAQKGGPIRGPHHLPSCSRWALHP